MKRDNGKPAGLDEIVESIVSQDLAAEIKDQAAARVSAKLASGEAVEAGIDTIRTCADFQALIPAYLTGSLTEAREALVRDHTGSCVPCRRAMRTVRDGEAVTASTHGIPSRWASGLAAAVVLGLMAGSLYMVRELRTTDGQVAQIESIQGALYRADGQVSLASGEKLRANDRVRTAKGSGAFITLTDGSVVEMAERSELAINPRRSGTTIELGRGNVIVHAAKQRTGHLFVHTDDCLVSVKGTTFAVNHGTKGSRVSVIEGRVEVDDGRDEHVLRAGDQVSTNPSLGRVPVADEIAWSRQFDQHIAVLAEIADIGLEIERNIPTPAARASSRLLRDVPLGTVVYGAVPNLSRSLSDAYELFKSRISQSDVLEEWWSEATISGDEGELEAAIDRVRELGAYLGDEVIFTVQMDADGHPDGHLVLAETTSTEGLRNFLDTQIASLDGDHDIVILDDPATFATQLVDHDVLYIWIHDGMVAASTKPENMLALAEARRDPGASFVGTSFHDRIAATYADGVSWLFAADMETIWAERFDAERLLSADRAQERDAFEEMGLLDLQHVILDQRSADGRSHKRARLTFDQPRRGLASWLAAPGPMASLDFLSPEATLATAFVVEEPVKLVDDLFAALQKLEPDFGRELAEFEAETGLKVRDDIARPLGGEVVFAIDGPLLPKPSWKLVLEVYDPAALTATIEQIVTRINDELTKAGEDKRLDFERATVAGREFFAIVTPDPAPSVHFVFVDGYMIAAPDRGLLDRAIRYRESGRNLAASPRFTALFPADGYTNFSAVVFQNLGALIAPLAGRLAGSEMELSSEQREAIQALAANAEPQFFYGYAHQNEILFAGTGRAGILGMDLRTLISLHGLLDLQESMEHAARDGQSAPAAEHKEATP